MNNTNKTIIALLMIISVMSIGIVSATEGKVAINSVSLNSDK